MANPSKAKGTSGEGEVRDRLIPLYGLYNVVRTPPASAVDLIATGLGPNSEKSIDVLYTRPDRGYWLVTLRASDFEDLIWDGGPSLRIEVKRYARMAWHAIFVKKFPGQG